MKKVFLIVYLIVSGFIYGQVGISAGSTYTQDFNSMPNTKPYSLPSNWKCLVGQNYNTIENITEANISTSQIGGNGLVSDANAGTYNFGAGIATSATDRALGGICNSGEKAFNIILYLQLKNTGLTSINRLSISYNVEKYRNGTYSKGTSIKMYKSNNGSNWESAGDDFTTNYSPDSDNNGFSPAPDPSQTIQIRNKNMETHIAPNETLYLAWRIYGTLFSLSQYRYLQALAIDDVYINAQGLPTILTYDFSNMTMNSIQYNGLIDSDGIDVAFSTDNISEKGVCWSTEQNPTIDNSHTIGEGLRGFFAPINLLDPSQIYYVRAYATNYIGTGYGEQKILKIAPKANLGMAVNNNSFTASWEAIDGAESYLLDVATSKNFDADCIEGYNNFPASSTSQEITGLTAGNTYYYRVRAISGVKNSCYSDTIRVTTLGSNGNNGIVGNTGNQNITIGNGTGIGEIQFGNITQTGNILVNHYNNPPANYGTSLPAQVSNYRWVIEPNNNLVINEATGYKLHFEVANCPGITEYANEATTNIKLYKRSNPGNGNFSDCGFLVYYNNGTVNNQNDDYLLSQLITTGFSEFVFGSESAFPVELSSFSAAKSDNKVTLNWVTATELNNNGFEIERKVSSNNWEKIGTVAGFGNSNSIKEYSFTDNNLTITGKYLYRLKQIDNDGKFTYSNIIEVNIEAPKEFELVQNYPNPFNPETTINYSIPQNGNVKLFIFNTLGEKITTLVDGFNEAGTHSVKFNAGNLPSGIYFYQINSGNFTEVKKMTLTK